jgi:hypothetical protein
MYIPAYKHDFASGGRHELATLFWYSLSATGARCVVFIGFLVRSRGSVGPWVLGMTIC